MICLFLSISLFINVVRSQTNCIASYSNLAIKGNDINGVQGSASSCCQSCQQKRGCLAYFWDDFNGGTCWLKNDTQPLYVNNGSSAGILSPNTNNTYSLLVNYDATNFLTNSFSFIHSKDPSQGFVNYTDQTTAEQTGLIKIQNGKVFIGVDNKTILEPNSTYGRNAVRVESLKQYNAGLFIFNIDHMPTGKGLWPAFWSYGPSWPNSGEIDILEGVWTMNYNQISLHTREGCDMQVNDSIYFNGTWVLQYNKPGTNCYIHAPGEYPGDAGCSIAAPVNTFNNGFNQAGGGVFAMEWEHEKFLRIWNFVNPNVPSDIASDNPNPNPSAWGLPTAYFTIGPNCTADHFANQWLVINSDLCGWAGTVGFKNYTECKDVVRNHPEEFSEAYWLINYLRVYCKPGQPCLAA